MNKKLETKRLEEIVKILLKYDLKKGITPDKLCSIIEELGPTFIKIGQILSTRIDIIPKNYIEALSKLRSNVKQISKEEINSILDLEYKNKDEVFESIDELLGAGSIAQVHKATLKNGEKVVIKVCKKNVYEQMSLDVSLMKKAIKTLHLNKLIKII